MGSLGGMEILLLFALALLLFGPRKLPEIGKTVGKTVGEFRKATLEFKTSLEREVELEKLKETTGAIKEATRFVQHPGRTILDAATQVMTPPAETSEPRPSPPSDVVPRDPA
jgi:Tat protein translocase TatB subunit